MRKLMACAMMAICSNVYAADCEELLDIKTWSLSTGSKPFAHILGGEMPLSSIPPNDYLRIKSLLLSIDKILEDRKCLDEHGTLAMYNVRGVSSKLRTILQSYEKSELTIWNSIDTNDGSAIRDFLSKYPQGKLLPRASSCLREIPRIDSIKAFKQLAKRRRSSFDSLFPEMILPSLSSQSSAGAYRVAYLADVIPGAHSGNGDIQGRIEHWKDSVSFVIPEKGEFEKTDEFLQRDSAYKLNIQEEYGKLWTLLVKQSPAYFASVDFGGIVKSQKPEAITFLSYDADAEVYLIQLSGGERSGYDTVGVVCNRVHALELKRSGASVGKVRYFKSPSLRNPVALDVEISGRVFTTTHTVVRKSLSGDLQNFSIYTIDGSIDQLFYGDMYLVSIARFPSESDVPEIAVKKFMDGSKLIVFTNTAVCEVHQGVCGDEGLLGGYFIYVDVEGLAEIRSLGVVEYSGDIILRERGEMQIGELLVKRRENVMRQSQWDVILPRMNRIRLTGKLYGPFMRDPDNDYLRHNLYPIFIGTVPGSLPQKIKNRTKIANRSIEIMVFQPIPEKMRDKLDLGVPTEVEVNEFIDKKGGRHYVGATVVE